MDISAVVIGLVRFFLKPIADLFEMLLYRRAYEISTLYRNHREAFGVKPGTLVDGVEFKVLWKPYHLRKKLVTPMIWVRAKNGGCFSRIVLVVTAINSKIKYQDHITLFCVDEIPVQSALPSIPFRSLTFDRRMVFTPYDYIKVEVQALYDDKGGEIRVFHQSKRDFHPFDRLEVAMGLEKGDVEKWGEVFNLEFIEMIIKEERVRLVGPMFSRLNPLRESLNKPRQTRRLFRTKPDFS